MKEKIEEILKVVWEDNNSWESEGSEETIKKALKKLSTLIQSERKKAVKGFAHWCESNKLGSCVLSDAEEYLSQLNKEEE